VPSAEAGGGARRHQGRITPSLLARSAEFRDQFWSLSELRLIGRCNCKLVAEGMMGGGGHGSVECGAEVIC
jgi:hypothetical protein